MIPLLALKHFALNIWGLFSNCCFLFSGTKIGKIFKAKDVK